ncbi:MAG TPA: hypothetical protein VK997_06535 [Deferrisomatales bacterium]|nr:hypothetical protein [Deferrisomatales bacterium]
MRIVVGMCCLLLAGWPGGATAGRQHREAWYQGQWCAERGGETEVVLEDGTRVDCVTATHAVEFEFADKWAEAIGQSLHYARRTGRRAGVVLILEDAAARRYWQRLTGNIAYFGLPIDVWQVGEGWSTLIGELSGKRQGAAPAGWVDPG